MQDLISTDVVCDGNVHVMPVQDYIAHIEGATCLCVPKLELIPADPANGIMNTVLFYTHNTLSGEILND
jgi:hypothetical protein